MAKAQAALDQVNRNMRETAVDADFQVVDNVIIGEVDGQPAYEAVGTVTWAPLEVINGQYGFLDPLTIRPNWLDAMKNVDPGELVDYAPAAEH
jgi:hypothetical protein